MKLSGWKNILRITLISQAQGGLFCVLTVFACHWESSDPRLNEMHELQSFAPCKEFLFNMFFFFSSLENYFGFRITKRKGKMDHSVSQRRNKKFWTFPKGQVFFWLCIRIICKWILCAVFHLNSFTGLNYNPLVFSYK